MTTCNVCLHKTKGWVTTSLTMSDDSPIYTYCSYECYKKNPTILPCCSSFKCLDQENPEQVILPLSKEKAKEEKKRIKKQRLLALICQIAECHCVIDAYLHCFWAATYRG